MEEILRESERERKSSGVKTFEGKHGKALFWELRLREGWRGEKPRIKVKLSTIYVCLEK
jgi:hypothetical protein